MNNVAARRSRLLPKQSPNCKGLLRREEQEPSSQRHIENYYLRVLRAHRIDFFDLQTQICLAHLLILDQLPCWSFDPGLALGKHISVIADG